MSAQSLSGWCPRQSPGPVPTERPYSTNGRNASTLNSSVYRFVLRSPFRPGHSFRLRGVYRTLDDSGSSRATAAITLKVLQ